MLPSYILQRVYSLHLSQLVAKFHIKTPCCKHKKGLNLQTKFKHFNDDGGTESFKMNEQSDHHKEIGQPSDFKSQPLIPLDALETKGPPKKPKKHTRSTKSTIGENTSNILFGIHPVSLALQAKRREFNKLYLKKTKNHVSPKIEEIQRLAREIEVPVEMVTREMLDKMSDKRPHQGVCLDAGPLNPPFLADDRVIHSQNGEQSQDPLLWLLINEIIDPMNLGAILRSAYYLGVDRVLGPFKGNCRLSPVVSKASSGILEVINYNYVTDVKELIKTKLSENWDVIGTIIEGPSILNPSVLNVEQYSLKKPSLIIIGNEGDGLDETILNLCTILLTISQEKGMHHQISLNVSVATGIILHSLKRNASKR